LELIDIPEKLLIVGGGYIGVEMAIIYSVFGTKVSVAELTDDFLPGMDEDLVTEHKKAGSDIYEDVFMNTSVENIEEEEDMLLVNFKDKNDKLFSKKYNKVLVA